ncbi:MAG: YqaE/Pmp3 family membrane protein [Halomonas sp.]|nr:YqaE/Pmp3 family membrane protein [Halomonas sp.]MCC5882357.1 YqaE/Pmp3 family membrane protein [Halomonas sp.]
MDAREYLARKGLDGSRDEERPNTLEEKAWERARQAGGHQPRAGTPHDWEDWERYHDELADGAEAIEQKIAHESHHRDEEQAQGETETPPSVQLFDPASVTDVGVTESQSSTMLPSSASSSSSPRPGRNDSHALRFAYAALAILLPPLAVGLARGGARRVVTCLALTLLGWVPGSLYAWSWVQRRHKVR